MDDRVIHFKQQALSQGYSPQEVDAFIAQQMGGQPQPQVQDVATQAAQPKSSFIGNVGRDIGENIQGLLSIPGVIRDVAKGDLSGGEVGEAVVTGIVDEYKDLFTKPGETLYNKPVSSALNILPFAQLTKLTKARHAGKIGKAAKAADTAGDVASAQKAARVLTKAEGTTLAKNSTAASALAESLTVPRKLARWYKPEQTMQQLLDYKIPANSLDDYALASRQLTGETGVFSNVNRQVLGMVPEVEISNVYPAVNNFVKQQATLTAKDAKQINNYLPKTSGKKIGFHSADDMWDSMKQLEDQGYQLLNSSTDLSPNLRNEQLGRAYLAAADELQGSISQAVKKSGALDAFKTPEIVSFLENISPKLAKEYINAKSFNDIRSLQKPFVRFSKMMEISENAASSPFGRLSQTMTKGQGLGILNQIPGAQKVLGKPAEKLGEFATIKGAQAMSSSPFEMAQSALSKGFDITKQAIKRPETYIAGRQLPGLGDETSFEETMDTSMSMPQQDFAQDTPQNPYPIENYIADITRDPKNKALYKSIYDEYTKMYGQGTGASAQTVQRAKSALNEIENVKRISDDVKNMTGTAKAFSVQTKLSAPGAMGRPFIGGGDERKLAELEASYFVMVQTALTTIQGSRPSDYDAKLYQDRLGPSIMNTPEVNADRTRIIEGLMRNAIANPSIVGTQTQDAQNALQTMELEY